MLTEGELTTYNLPRTVGPTDTAFANCKGCAAHGARHGWEAPPTVTRRLVCLRCERGGICSPSGGVVCFVRPSVAHKHLADPNLHKDCAPDSPASPRQVATRRVSGDSSLKATPPRATDVRSPNVSGPTGPQPAPPGPRVVAESPRAKRARLLHALASHNPAQGASDEASDEVHSDTELLYSDGDMLDSSGQEHVDAGRAESLSMVARSIDTPGPRIPQSPRVGPVSPLVKRARFHKRVRPLLHDEAPNERVNNGSTTPDETSSSDDGDEPATTLGLGASSRGAGGADGGTRVDGAPLGSVGAAAASSAGAAAPADSFQTDLSSWEPAGEPGPATAEETCANPHMLETAMEGGPVPAERTAAAPPDEAVVELGGQLHQMCVGEGPPEGVPAEPSDAGGASDDWSYVATLDDPGELHARLTPAADADDPTQASLAHARGTSRAHSSENPYPRIYAPYSIMHIIYIIGGHPNDSTADG
jgi:hypothetical protein